MYDTEETARSHFSFLFHVPPHGPPSRGKGVRGGSFPVLTTFLRSLYRGIEKAWHAGCGSWALPKPYAPSPSSPPSYSLEYRPGLAGRAGYGPVAPHETGFRKARSPSWMVGREPASPLSIAACFANPGRANTKKPFPPAPMDALPDLTTALAALRHAGSWLQAVRRLRNHPRCLPCTCRTDGREGGGCGTCHIRPNMGHRMTGSVGERRKILPGIIFFSDPSHGLDAWLCFLASDTLSPKEDNIEQSESESWIRKTRRTVLLHPTRY